MDDDSTYERFTTEIAGARVLARVPVAAKKTCAGVGARAAFGRPPRGPGCRRSSASEQGLALPAALDLGCRGRDRGARRGAGARGGDGERAFRGPSRSPQLLPIPSAPAL